MKSVKVIWNSTFLVGHACLGDYGSSGRSHRILESLFQTPSGSTIISLGQMFSGPGVIAAEDVLKRLAKNRTIWLVGEEYPVWSKVAKASLVNNGGDILEVNISNGKTVILSGYQMADWKNRVDGNMHIYGRPSGGTSDPMSTCCHVADCDRVKPVHSLQKIATKIIKEARLW
jgi:hypothetical protein